MPRFARRLLEPFGLEVRRIQPASDLRLLQLAERARGFQAEDRLTQQFVAFALQRAHRTHAQLFQDVLVEFVLGKRNGSFIEIGAFDGQTLSNTLYLERDLGWTGVLAEPARVHHATIEKSRPGARLERRCVLDVTGMRVSFSEMELGELSTVDGFGGQDHLTRHRRARRTYEVETVSLDDLVREHFGGETVDYVSIDTEGTEARILSSYSFLGAPAILTVEHNYTPHRETIRQLLAERGYVNLMPRISCFDDWYVRHDVHAQRLAPS